MIDELNNKGADNSILVKARHYELEFKNFCPLHVCTMRAEKLYSSLTLVMAQSKRLWKEDDLTGSMES